MARRSRRTQSQTLLSLPSHEIRLYAALKVMVLMLISRLKGCVQDNCLVECAE